MERQLLDLETDAWLWPMLSSSARDTALVLINDTLATSIFRYEGKGILEQGQEMEIQVSGALSHHDDFLGQWSQVSRIFVSSGEAFLPSVW